MPAPLNNDISFKRLQRFPLLTQVQRPLAAELLAAIEYRTCPQGGHILRQRDADSGDYSFLLDGRIEQRLAFDKRPQLDSDDERCLHPLEQLIQGGGSVRALSDCQLIIIAKAALQALLDRQQQAAQQIQQPEAFAVVDLQQDGHEQHDTIDDDFSEDWTANFLQSPLASQLPPANLHALFSKLESIEVNQGEQIIREYSEADYFYIVETGYAHLDFQSGPFAGQSIELAPGSYFGDEALVAETIRNAGVNMSSDGRLLRLGRDDFQQIIKDKLLKSFEGDPLSPQCQLLDVRLPAEYRHNSRSNSINLPVATIRERLPTLTGDKHYVITPEGGKRSELAAYLLCQAGLEVSLLQEA